MPLAFLRKAKVPPRGGKSEFTVEGGAFLIKVVKTAHSFGFTLFNVVDVYKTMW